MHGHGPGKTADHRFAGPLEAGTEYLIPKRTHRSLRLCRPVRCPLSVESIAQGLRQLAENDRLTRRLGLAKGHSKHS